MSQDVNNTINVGSVSYDVELDPAQNGYRIAYVKLTAPTITLYFNPAEQVFEINVFTNVVYKVQVNGGLKDVIVNTKTAQDIENYGFCSLWSQLSKQSPLSSTVNSVISKILCALETVVKATEEAHAQNAETS